MHLRHTFLFLTLLIISSSVLSQANYRPGYLIDTDGERLSVSILDRDWVDNPRRFRYRIGEETLEGSLSDIREFGYDDGSLRYLRSAVDIDQSSDQPNRLSASEIPEYRRDTVFLEWLVDGEADLFYYEEGELRRFYYRIPEQDPQPLIARRYMKGRQIIRQQLYRGQLRNDVRCGDSDADLREVDYERRALVRYFEAYHMCRETDYKVALRERPLRPVHLSLRPGGEWFAGYMGVDGTFGRRKKLPLRQMAAVRIGLEAEYVIPLRNEHWRIFSELYYHRLQGTEVEEGSSDVTFNLRSVNWSLGARAYLPLSPSVEVFANAGGVLQFPWKSFVGRRTATTFMQSDASWNFGVLGGVGVELRKRYQLEVRYQHDHDVLQNYIYQSTHFRIFSLIAGYRLL